MKAYILSLLIFISIPVFSTYRGTVYQKNNHNSIPIEGVIVTDGKNVTKTDKNGEFSLPGFEKTRFITITTPSGYTTNNFYIPIKSGNESYIFYLEKNDKTKNRAHSFVQITDTEVHNGLGIWTTYLRDYIKNEQPAFLMHTGDICYEYGMKIHAKAINSQTMGIPVYYGIGNHDLVKGPYAERLYESLYGPTWYSFNIGNTHYIMTPMANGDYKPSYTREDVYHWLKNDLSMMEEGQSLVIFNHDILSLSDDFIFGINDKEFINLRDYNIKAQIYGHMHYNYVRNQGDVYTICTSTIDKGGIDHSTSAFRILDIAPNDSVTSRLRYAYISPQAVITSPLEGQYSPTLSNGEIPISINTYNSISDTKNVEYILTDIESNTKIVRGYIKQPKTDWNWYDEIAIPIRYSSKKIRIEAIVTFNNEQRITTSNTFHYRKNFKPSIKLGKNWNTLLQNAQHTGDTATKINTPLQLAWVNNVNANIYMTSPLIADGKVFIASTDDNIMNKSSITAFDIQSGRLLWKYKTLNSIKNTIAYHNNIVVAQDAECNLYAINTNSGELLWQHKIGLTGFPYLSEGLTINNNIVYAGTGKGLAAYNIDDGQIIWKNTGWDQYEGATTTSTIANNILVSGAQWGGLFANNAITGDFLWKLSDNGISDRGSSPVYQDGKLYLISRKSLFMIEPTNGTILKTTEFPFDIDVTSTPLITANEIIFGSATKGLIALDKEFLKIKWNIQTNTSLVFTTPYSMPPSATVETSPILSQNTVYFGASDGYLYAVNLNTGIIEQKINLGAPIFNSPAISGNTLVIADYSGNVYTFVSEN